MKSRDSNQPRLREASATYDVSTATDWERVSNLSQEEADARAEVDFAESGAPDDNSAQWINELPPMPEPKQQITLRIDADIIDWFRTSGKGYQTRMNAVLRRYMEHHRDAS